MGKPVVTAADQAKADTICELLGVNTAPVRKATAQLFADYREEILSCAMVRVERLMEVKYRKQPGLPLEGS